MVIQNGVAILDNCYLQLLNVKDNDGLISYEVSIKNNASDFFQTINNKELTDINISDFQHTLDSTYVVNSFSNTADFKYILPYFEGQQVTVAEALFCVYAKTYFDRIFQGAGYRYTWATLQDQRFDKLLIPYNGEGYDARLQETVEAKDSNLLLTNVFNTQEIKLILPEVIDEAGRYNPVNGNYTAGSSFIGSNTLKFTFTVDGVAEITNSTGSSFTFANNIDYNFYIAIYRNNTLLNAVDFTKIQVAQNTILGAGASLTNSFNGVVQLSLNGINQSDVLNFWVGAYVSVNNNITQDYSFLTNEVDFNSVTFNIQPTSRYVFSGVTVDPNQYIPRKIKQADFIKSIFQMFNLFADIDTNDPNLLILSTRDDFYDNGTLKDWTDKLAKNLEITQEFLPDVTAKKYLLSYKPDKDQTNEIYTNATKEVYGQLEYTFNSEFVRDKQTNEIIFSPTPFTTTPVGLTLPYIQGKAPKNNIRILYDGGMFGCGQYYVNDFVDFDGIQDNQYPLAIHFDDPSAPTFDINFSTCDFYFKPLVSLTNNNLFNIYWRRTLGQINSGRLISAYFNLNELDIHLLKLSDKIQVGNTLYNINKVIDYDANANKLTKVELMTIDADVLLAPFITRRIQPLSNTDFDIFISNNTNIIQNGAMVNGDNNNVNGGVVIGDGNTSVDAIVLGNNNTILNVDNVLVVGNNQKNVESNSVVTNTIQAQQTIDILTKQVTTTNATITQAKVLTNLLAESCYIIEAYIVAYEEDGSTRTMGQRLIGVFEVRGGTTVQISSSDSLRKSEFSATVTASYSVVSNDIVLSVTGLSATTIQWHVSFNIHRTDLITIPPPP